MKPQILKCIVGDCLLPFALGFLAVFLVSWLKVKLVPEPNELNNTFRDYKTGQVFLKRHGLGIPESQENLIRPSDRKLEMSMIALGEKGFRKAWIRNRRQKKRRRSKWNNESKPQKDPVGAIWSWPKLERDAPSRPLVWVVTPTYRSPLQYAELTRIAQALYPCRRFVRWLVIDDTRRSAKYPKHLGKLKDFLKQFKVRFVLMKCKGIPKGQMLMYNPKGVAARRTAIAYIRKNKKRGVVFFADDDNTYDSDIFRQMQSTKKVSVWPIGAITEWTVSAPVVNENGTVVDFFDAFTANRRFPVDFASFAINADLLFKNPRANIPWIQGYEETIFLSKLRVKKEEFQPLAANATEILTWHTKTISNYPKYTSHTSLQDTMKELRKPHWPKTVRDLAEKYDFIFENPRIRPKPASDGDSYRYYSDIEDENKIEGKEVEDTVEVEGGESGDEHERTEEPEKETESNANNEEDADESRSILASSPPIKIEATPRIEFIPKDFRDKYRRRMALTSTEGEMKTIRRRMLKSKRAELFQAQPIPKTRAPRLQRYQKEALKDAFVY